MSYENMNVQELEIYLKATESDRDANYRELLTIFDEKSYTPEKVLTILDALMAQTILHFVKDRYNALRIVDGYNKSTKETIRGLFKEGKVKK